jgi:CheY-like chemotaxis protein
LPTTVKIIQDLRSDSLVAADPTQIHQVLLNLCTNAGQAMKEKGGVLEVKLKDVKFETDFKDENLELKRGSYLELIVSDTGYGMPSHVLDRIFDPFFTTKEIGEGTGMGLSVVHGIVGSYRGAIAACSDPDEGSTFKVYLPVVERQLEPQTQAEGPAANGTERILFVDDEPGLVNIGKQMLESLGYTVTTRTSSLEAFELFKAEPDRFDLVITDMAMPNMPGDILSTELMKVRPEIPVILCTGYSSKISDEIALQKGIKAFAYKPIAMHDLTKSVRKVLDEAKSIK